MTDEKNSFCSNNRHRESSIPRDDRCEDDLYEPETLIDSHKDYINYYFDKVANLLSNTDLINQPKFYNQKLVKLSFNYANNLKDILKYKIPIILGYKITYDTWYNLLNFHWDNEIRRVLYGESYAVSFEKLQKIKEILIDLYNNKINISNAPYRTLLLFESSII